MFLLEAFYFPQEKNNHVNYNYESRKEIFIGVRFRRHPIG